MKTLLLVALLAMLPSCQSKTKTIEIPGVPPPLKPGEVPTIPPPAKSSPNFVSFARQESDQLEVLQGVSQNDQKQTRFITTCEQYNSGDKNLDPFIKAVDKGLNSVSNERKIELTRGAGNTGCTRAFDLREVGLTPAKWQIIVNKLNDLFGASFESFTTRGVLIKQLTQTQQAAIPAHIYLFIPLTSQFMHSCWNYPSNSLACKLRQELTYSWISTMRMLIHFCSV